jgi:putative flippase GtrA
VVGVSNTVLGLGIIYIAWNVFGIGDIAANLLGYLAGFLWGYVWNKSWTFSAAPKGIEILWRYSFVCVLAYSANLATLTFLRSVLGPDSFLPHAVGTLVYAGLSYIGSCYFAFSSSSLGK